MHATNLISEESIPNFSCRGHCHFYEGASTENWRSAPTTNIIQTDQPWYVLYHFNTDGLLNHIMAGEWNLELFLEKMGGEEFDLNPAYAKDRIPFVSRPYEYYKWAVIPPKEVPAGVYKAVASVTFKGPLGVPGPIAMFADIGMVQFYDEGPQPPGRPTP